MEPLQFIRALQLTDSFFPVGAFAYSDGLETAVARGRVRDAITLGKWMEHFLEAVFVPCEGLALVKCMLALKAGDFETLCNIDEELTAIRPAGAPGLPEPCPPGVPVARARRVGPRSAALSTSAGSGAAAR